MGSRIWQDSAKGMASRQRPPLPSGQAAGLYRDGVTSLLLAALTTASAIASSMPPAPMDQGTRRFASGSSATRVLAAGRSVQVVLNSWLVGWSVTLVNFTLPGGSTSAVPKSGPR